MPWPDGLGDVLGFFRVPAEQPVVRLALLLCPVSLLDAPDATKWGIAVGLVKREKKVGSADGHCSWGES